MPIRPLHDYLLVKRQDPEKQSKGGIIIPDDAQEQSETASVVAVGPGGRAKDGTLVPLDVTPGDQVLIAKFAGQKLTVDGEELQLVRAEDVLGVVYTAAEPSPPSAADTSSSNPLQGPDGEPRACPTCHQPPPGFEHIGAVAARS